MTFFAIGVTASREGVSETQRRALTTFLLRARAAGADRFHHGCCVGGDEIAAVIAHNLGYRVVGHPPVKTQWRSMLACGVSNELRDPLDYLARDVQIVEEVDALIGLPNRPECGSGTWFTVRQARRANKPRLVLLPGGQVVDRVGVDVLYPMVQGEHAPTTTDQRIESGS